MRILVCGGRDYFDRDTVYKDLDSMNDDKATPITLLIHGGARGADYLAHRWALDRGIQTAVFEANWDIYGKQAGYLRNVAMADLQPDFVLAFPGGRGTQMMIEIARKQGIEVIKCT